MLPRYEDPNVSYIFSDQQKYHRWALVETAAMRALGRDPGLTDHPDPVQVAEQERVTKHDVAAFLRAWLALNPQNETLQRWVHYGLTSSNVTDTAQALAIDWASDLIIERATDLADTVRETVQEVMNHDQIARTHGRYAQVRSAGHPWLVYYHTLLRQIRRLKTATAAAAVGNLAGPVGTSSVFNETAWTQVLTELELSGQEYSSQIVPRDGLVLWATSLSQIAATCEAMATQIRLLSQSGIDEVGTKWSHQIGVVGSSAMPHKVNPALAENVCGLARMVRPIPAQLELGLIQWGEHDMAHSSVERVQIETLCHLVMAVLDRTQQLLRSTVWDFDQIAANLAIAYELGEADSHKWMLELVDGGRTYLQAHEEVQRRVESKDWWGHRSEQEKVDE